MAAVTKPSPYVFTTAGDASDLRLQQGEDPTRPAIAKARDGVALAPWTIHDLRRTAATEMGRLGVSRFIIGKVLNHADRSVTGIYDRHAYLQEKRQALDVWAQRLSELTVPPPSRLRLAS